MIVTSIFPFSHNVFPKDSYIGSLKVVIVWKRVNPLPDDKILDVIKLKAFAGDKLNVTNMPASLYDRV